MESAVAVGQNQIAAPWDVDVLTLAWIVGRLDAHVDRRTMLLLAAGMTAEAAATIADPWERLTRALTGPQALDEETVERLEARTIGFHRLVLRSFLGGEIRRTIRAQRVVDGR
ncbi:hypothetical protein [Streptosporangium sp. NPDC051022]|uniref:hypothetical protein n=1 Tax=Streptosporangium sp. NPDC051022 TaxID=3155752 RepID=UPI00343FF5D9